MLSCSIKENGGRMPTAEMTYSWRQDTAQSQGTPQVQKWVKYEEPDDLKAEIEQAEALIESAGDLNGEGVQIYSRNTFDRAAAFLRLHSDLLLEQYRIYLPVPNIGPGPDGSIDIHWKYRSWELLVNIPANPDENAVFYGDNYGTQKIRGSVDPTVFNFGLFMWLMN
jgi:hypothetical protein